MGRGFFIWVSSVLLGCTLLLPSAVNAAADFEMQLPQVFLEGITYDLTVSSLATDLNCHLAGYALAPRQ